MTTKGNETYPRQVFFSDKQGNRYTGTDYGPTAGGVRDVRRQQQQSSPSPPPPLTVSDGFDSGLLNSEATFVPLHMRILESVLLYETITWITLFLVAFIAYMLFGASPLIPPIPATSSSPSKVLAALLLISVAIMTVSMICLTASNISPKWRAKVVSENGGNLERIMFNVFLAGGLGPFLVLLGIKIGVSATAQFCMMQWASSMAALLYAIQNRHSFNPTRMWQFMAVCAIGAWICGLIGDENRRDWIGSILALLVEVLSIGYRYIWIWLMVIQKNDFRVDETVHAWINLYTEITISLASAAIRTVYPPITTKEEGSMTAAGDGIDNV